MSEEKKLTVLLLHGCNLDMLGERNPEHYGSLTLQQLESAVVEKGRGLSMTVHSFQTNHEGALVEKIHEFWRIADAMIVNPGAWTHYSYAIRDALEMVEGPVVEVHLSDIFSREDWRRQSVISDVSAHTVAGKGVDGYLEALDWLDQNLRRAG